LFVFKETPACKRIHAGVLDLWCIIKCTTGAIFGSRIVMQGILRTLRGNGFATDYDTETITPLTVPDFDISVLLQHKLFITG